MTGIILTICDAALFMVGLIFITRVVLNVLMRQGPQTGFMLRLAALPTFQDATATFWLASAVFMLCTLGAERFIPGATAHLLLRLLGSFAFAAAFMAFEVAQHRLARAGSQRWFFGPLNRLLP